MRSCPTVFFVVLGFALGSLAHGADAPLPAPVPTAIFVEVEPNVKLEVLDWGGAGRPLVLLHGGGMTAHTFEGLAPRFLAQHRVVAITRRGDGISSAPRSGYDDERLGRDILSVVESLGLKKPVLIGHSLAGREMSWLNTHTGDSFAGFVYLDAAGSSAFYSEFSNELGYFAFTMVEMYRQIGRLIPGSGELHPPQVARDVLRDLPEFERQLAEWLDKVKDLPEPTAEQVKRMPPHMLESALGLQRYPALSGHILAIFAVPKDAPIKPVDRASQPAPRSLSQVDAFEYGVPNARVVRLPGASHFVYKSNGDDVVREINVFLNELER